jgi:5-methyltetrahydrofolate--homocysteine methyltransferase
MPRYADDRLRRVFEGNGFLLLDGAMGTMLQKSGMPAGESPEAFLLEHPEKIRAVHEAYVAAGSDAVTTCTFGANPIKEPELDIELVYNVAVREAKLSGAKYVAADVGPTGGLLAPLGTLSWDEVYDCYAVSARAIAATDADFILIETMADLAETKAALLAMKDLTDLPVVTSLTFGEDGLTFLGTPPEVAAATMDALGADAIGVNCSLGPDALSELVRRMAPYTSKPLICQANAGLPRIEAGVTTYGITPEDYAGAAHLLLDAGVTLIGGCCGTTPDYIARLRALVDGAELHVRETRPLFSAASSRKIVAFEPDAREVHVIGERINPTGRKKLKEALRAGDVDLCMADAIAQVEAGAEILDVNVGLPEIDEVATLSRVVEAVGSVVDAPLQIDSTDPAAVEAALKSYAGKPLVNSVNGSAESMANVLPLVARYGANVLALTLDENGIPETAEQRFAIAERIVREAATYGIGPERIVVDCLAMAASTNQAQVGEILRAISMVRERLGCATTLGVSNISFGLPARELVNSVFLANAISAGLNLPIMNPLSDRMREVVDTERVLLGQDAGCGAFIEGYADWKPAAGRAAAEKAVEAAVDGGDLKAVAYESILKGRAKPTAEAIQTLLADTDPLDLIDHVLIAALDEVGARFEKGTLFLPQLMASAEAAKAGFDVIRARLPKDDAGGRGTVVLATVKGDIHDIGKNIVGMLLENYGYDVVDLGRDVEPARVVEAVKETGAKLVGLSALMTTTVGAMADTIALLRAEGLDTKVMVGGAVLTQEYADMVGADFYTKDATQSARVCQEVLG